MSRCLIYDNNGNIVMSSTNINEETITSVEFIFVEDVEGKYIKSVNPETKEPVYEDIPKTEIQILKEKIVTLQQGVTELTDIVLVE